VSPMLFAANWKMHHGPAAARELVQAVLAKTAPREGRRLLFFPPAVSLVSAVKALQGRADAAVGAQNIHWEPKGAFTGELSAPLARDAGAAWVLVGHSERRHKFSETDAETGLKARAALAAGLSPMLCVGETLEQRERGQKEAVVRRQLEAGIGDLDAETLERVAIAYEPVWAIGTGVNATPEDAAAMHRMIRDWLGRRSSGAFRFPILYGGSVSPENVAALLAEPDLDGVLVGGASLTADSWLQIVDTPAARR
jgi:triosephosphate isomerase